VSHANARTTLHGRLLIVQRHQAGMPQAHIAKAMGISRKCVRTWISRFAEEGEEGYETGPHALTRFRDAPPRRSRRRSSSFAASTAAVRTGSASRSASLHAPWAGYCVATTWPTCPSATR
jgi:uncharacterized protein YjcR